MKKLILLLILALSLNGCGTVISKILPDDVYGGHTGYYSGTIFDTMVVGGVFVEPHGSADILTVPLALFFLADLPVSASMDTILLPFQFLDNRWTDFRYRY